METLSIEEQHRLQKELSSGEHVLWAAKPNRKVVFHRSDLVLIPFSFFWAGFSIFWELGVSGHGFAPDKNPSLFMELWGIPFVLMGQYFVWGRFLYAAWKKARILYAFTDERLLVIVRPPQAKIIASYLRAVPGIEKELRSDGIGTLKFGDTPRKSAAADGLYLSSGNPVFVDIDDADEVANRISTLIRRLNTATSSSS